MLYVCLYYLIFLCKAVLVQYTEKPIEIQLVETIYTHCFSSIICFKQSTEKLLNEAAIDTVGHHVQNNKTWLTSTAPIR